MNEDDKTYPPVRGAPRATSSALQIAPGAVLKDTYRIEAELGSGGMGTVFRATHIGLDKTMAVKVLSPRAISSPESLARFGREAKVAGKVNHPAMTHVIDFGVEQGTPYIVMEYVDGMELAEFIERHGAMPPRQAVAVMRQIVSLLHAAHTLGIVHRDLKPANIKVVQAGPDDGQLFVKVLDFGIAKVIGDISGQLTSEGMMVGTPAYMAPEQISGKPIDGRTDLYAAGLIFHELLSGVRAFQGETIARILHAQLNEPPPPVSLPLPDVLRQTLQKFYEKRPEDRFQDAAQADRALMACEEALRSSPVSAAPSTVPPQGGAARSPDVTPESFSATMRRPESAPVQADASAVGGFSATMQRPESAAGERQPPPPAVSPPRPVTDRQLAPAPAPSTTAREPMPGPLAPTPDVRPAPLPNTRPAPNQRGRPSAMGRGCLAVVLVSGVVGCLGMTGVAAWAWPKIISSAQMQQGSSPGNFMPPQGPMGGAAEPAEEDDDDEEEESEAAAAQAAHPSEEGPGCFLSELIFEADRDQNGHYGTWAFVSFASREPIACPSTRRKPLSREARQLKQTWPVEEELLQVELSPPQPDPNNPGFFRKLVRAQTRVAEEAP
jgi:serine/threonine protein kinase